MVDKDETSLEGAIRELKEELGIEVSESDFDFIISFKREHVFVDVWLIELDIELEELHLQKEEVSEARWVSIAELKKMVEDGSFVKSTKLYFELFERILEKCYGLSARQKCE